MSISITDSTGAVVVTYQTNKTIKQVELFTFPATADATQGDYVCFSNVSGQTFAAWLDIDTDGTEPTGLFYGNSVVQIKVPIVTGGTAADNGLAFLTACEADLDWAGITLTDNEDGTVKVAQDVAGSCGDALAFNADDSEDGSIAFSMVSQGLSPTTTRVDSFTKGLFTTVADVRRNILVFNASASDGVGAKGKESVTFNYADIVAPSSTDVLDLKTQIDAFAATGTGSGDVWVVNEAAKVLEYTGLNSVFTTTNQFVLGSVIVVHGGVILDPNTMFTAANVGSLGTITFLLGAPDPLTGSLLFNYKKL